MYTQDNVNGVKFLSLGNIYEVKIEQKVVYLYYVHNKGGRVSWSMESLLGNLNDGTWKPITDYEIY